MAFVAVDSLAGLNVASKGLRASAVILSDIAQNDSDKTLDLAADLNQPTSALAFHVTGIRIEYSATATGGTRGLHVQFQDSAGDIIWHYKLEGFDVEADEDININMGANVPQYTGSQEGRERLPGNMWLRPDWKIRIYDNAAVDAAADDMIVHIIGILHWF